MTVTKFAARTTNNSAIVRSAYHDPVVITTWGTETNGIIRVGWADDTETDTVLGGEVSIDFRADFEGRIDTFMSVPSMQGTRFEVMDRAYILEVALRVAEVATDAVFGAEVARMNGNRQTVAKVLDAIFERLTK